MINKKIFLIVLIFPACNNFSDTKISQQRPENSTNAVVKLIDSLGTITLSMPLRYDTNFSWVQYSDCGKSCDEEKYRFQPKRLPINRESGWFNSKIKKDSTEEFTISHKLFFPFHEGDTSRDIQRHNVIKSEIMFDFQNPSIAYDTIEKINDRYFTIIAIKKDDTIHSMRVLAITTIKSNEIRFEFELTTKKLDSIGLNFIDNSIKVIRTIRLSKGV
ncbi:MAG TPA: hypothetical protein VKR53_19865 [Puia sp.]|nr:hypothetical protein [Puia sp.]